MMGAIVGDVLGSVYEGHGTKDKRFRLYRHRGRPTDDSVLTIAVARAILESDGAPTEKDYAAALRDVGRRYPRAGYGGSFRRWLDDERMGPYQSWGNGSAMRSSAAGWAFDRADEVLRQAELTALPTHDHPEGIKGARAVALGVFLARQGASRDEIRTELTERFGYDLSRTTDQIRPGYSFDVSCQGSVPEAIIAFLDSADFEDAIRNAVSLGGDADTQACIAGAIAEAFYGGVPDSMLAWVLPRLDAYLLRIVCDFTARYLPETRAAKAAKAESGVTTRVPPREPAYRILLHGGTWSRLQAYAERLSSRTPDPGDMGSADGPVPGERLAPQLEISARLPGGGDGNTDDTLTLNRSVTADVLLDALLNTKRPRIFAESEVVGDGSDWTAEELGLLGDIGIAVPVTIFDDGRHVNPEQHEPPFRGTLLFVPGALLRADSGGLPADREVVQGERIDRARYDALYERRLLPLLTYASTAARAAGRKAIVTIPGLGCGQFAGRFRGTLGPFLRDAIRATLERHAAGLPGIRTVWYDPYGECENERHEIGSISFLVRPLLKNTPDKPQLCRPETYEEPGDDYSSCDLYSMVAWDHVSWPGNDFFAGARSTDDGVKAAATDSMYAMTGFRGSYDRSAGVYRPPADMRTWEELVLGNRLRIRTEGNVIVVDGRLEAGDSFTQP